MIVEFVNQEKVKLSCDISSPDKRTPADPRRGVVATVEYTLFEKRESFSIDLSYFDKMRKAFLTKFVQRASKERNLGGLVCLEDFLKNYQPFLKMVCATGRTQLYDDFTDCFLLLKFVASIIHSNTQSLKHSTFKLLKSTLKYLASNPIVYIFLVFSILEKNVINDFEYEDLLRISNSELADFLVKRLTENNEKEFKTIGSAGPGLETVYMLSLMIQLVEDHYLAIVEMMKEVKTAKEREQAYQKHSVAEFRAQQSNVEPLTQVRSKEAEDARSSVSVPGQRKRKFSANLSDHSEKFEMPADPLDQNGVLAECSIPVMSARETDVGWV